jgi:translation elongation factor EF-4
MIFLLNNKPVDALALIVHRSAEQTIGRVWVKKLRERRHYFDFRTVGYG